MDRKMETVRKLLALAEGAATEAEAEAARTRALEMMQRYAIDEALLTGADERTTRDKVGTRTFVINGWVKPKSEMLAWIGTAFGCRTVQLPGKTTGRSTCVVYGWEADLEVVAVLFASLEIQAMREVKMARARQPWGNGQTFTRSFLVGFASTVAGRLQEQRTAVVAESPGAAAGTDLVLVDRKKAVDKHYRQQNPRVRTIRTSSVTSGDALGAGRAAGARADLGGASGVSGGTRRAIGG